MRVRLRLVVVFVAVLVGALVSLSVAGCSDDTPAPEPSAVRTRTFAEFFVAVDDDFVFERVDRVTPEPLEAHDGEPCFTDPAWVSAGAPYDRGDSRPELPRDTQRGEVNMMQQCDLPSDP